MDSKSTSQASLEYGVPQCNLILEVDSDIVARGLTTTSSGDRWNASVLNGSKDLLRRNLNVVVHHAYKKRNQCTDWPGNYVLFFPLGNHRLGIYPSGLDILLLGHVVGSAMPCCCILLFIALMH